MNDVKPKRKYVRKAKVVVAEPIQQQAEQAPKPKRKYVRKAKLVVDVDQHAAKGKTNRKEKQPTPNNNNGWLYALIQVIFEISRSIGSTTITNIDHIKPQLDRISAIKANHDNNTVQATIYLKLQNCRDLGILEFVKGKPGTYKLITHPHDALAKAKKQGNSRGEQILEMLFNMWSIQYISQFVDRRIRNINALRYDFYIPSINTLIEYDGADHNGPVARSKSLVKNAVRYFERKIIDAYKTSCAEKLDYKVVRVNSNMFAKGIPTLERMMELDVVKKLLLQRE